MKKLLTLGLLLAGLIVSGTVAADTVKIVALVNGEIISSEDIQNRINAFLLTTKIPYNEQTKNIIAQRVLTAAIDEKIKLQEASKNGIEISPDEIKNQFSSFEKSHKIPHGQLKLLLSQYKVSEETFTSQMKSDLAWVRLIRKKSYADGMLTQKEIEQALSEARKDLTTPKYLVSEIFIKKENARSLEDLITNLRTDNRFDLYAMQFSDSPSAANGGNLGWINSGKLNPSLEKSLKKMKVGEVSDPVMVGDGFYILKLQKTFDPAKDKGELPGAKEIRVFLENQKMETLSKKMLQNLRQRAVIEMRS